MPWSGVSFPSPPAPVSRFGLRPYTARVTDADLLIRTRLLEERLFPEDLHPTDSMRMKNPAYSWLYRPSHHVESGLVTEEDIERLKTGATMLSVGAYPAHLERVLLELRVPASAITLADTNPALLEGECPMRRVLFDMTEDWPAIGLFDLIVFPESLCIALSNRVDQENPQGEGPHPHDKREAELLAHVLEHAAGHLAPGGEIRADGPQSHPNVVRRAQASLEVLGTRLTIVYERYFLRCSMEPDMHY